MSDDRPDVKVGAIVLDGRPYRYWAEAVCDELLGADSPSPEIPLAGRLDLTLARGVVAADIHTRSHGLAIGRIERISQETRPEAIGLTYVLQGTCTITIDGREVQLRAGDVSLLTSERPFTKVLAGPTYREQFLYLPRPAVEALIGQGPPDPRRIVAPQEGLGALLADTLASLARRRPELRPEEWPPLLTAVLQLATATFTSAPAEAERSRPAARELQRQRVLRYIDQHLAEELTPGGIAAALGLSPRYLHLLFSETAETVGETILARRLERCRERILDPAARHLQITEIAFAHGFRDLAHFSRSFKARFGVRPRDLRAAALEGAALAP